MPGLNDAQLQHDGGDARGTNSVRGRFDPEQPGHGHQPRAVFRRHADSQPLDGADQSQAGEQELVILVTPELVHPLEKKEVPKLPGSDLFEPSDLEFFLFGKVESRRSRDYRSPVMNDPHRMIQYHQCEQTYIFGPVGHTDDPNYPFHPYDRYDKDHSPPPTDPRPTASLFP